MNKRQKTRLQLSNPKPMPSPPSFPTPLTMHHEGIPHAFPQASKKQHPLRPAISQWLFHASNSAEDTGERSQLNRKNCLKKKCEP